MLDIRNINILLLSSVLLTSQLLSGCAAAAVAGASVAAASSYQVATDRRTVKTIISDNSLRRQATTLLNDQSHYSDPVKIEISVFNHNMLLTGEASKQQDINLAIKMAHEFDGINHVINEIHLTSAPLNQKTTLTLKDAWITSQVKIKLAATKGITANHIKVVTNDKTVYLMGIVDQTEATKAAEIASNVNGVDKVIKLFEYQA